MGRRDAIQGSCNVTGMGRVIGPLREAYGGHIRRIDVTLVRRWADMEQTDKTFPDSIEMSPNPHHGEDARSYLGDCHTPVRPRRQGSHPADAPAHNGRAL